MTAITIDIGTLIVCSPDICGNRPRIAGTRMTVGMIATLWQQGLNAEQIQDEYSHLKLEQIYAALSYYHANRAEIEALLAKDLADYEKYRQMFAQKQEVLQGE